ncbi:hypothetical protein [Paraburkholderia sp. J94]|uniref:hypothetical protein n=1 Tax=Paraburkholderia sp. J94 TaxID=2805441 RepID=UPI002AB05106|nr:hypothetical protein [Paraburkholderia sp. J94]
MKSMILRNRGVMVSLSALALLASLVPTIVSLNATAQPPRPGEAGWAMSRSGAHAWPPESGGMPEGVNQPVPRGDLRGDIADNARRSGPPRSLPPGVSRR